MPEPRSKFVDALSWLRSMLLFDPLIYLYTMVLGTGSLICSLVDRQGRIQHWFARCWSWLILKTSLSPVEIDGLDRLDRSQAQVYAVNHLSAFDIPALYVSLPSQFRIMAKKELFRYPFLGWHLRRSGQLPIDQQSPAASIRSLKRAVDTLRAGMPLVVFPEGGRSEDGHVQAFMPGAFYIAIKAKAEVVPLAIVGTREILKMNTYHIRPGRIQLLVGEPIPTAGYSLRDMDVLAALVRKSLQDLYYSRSSLPDPRRQPAGTLSASEPH